MLIIGRIYLLFPLFSLSFSSESLYGDQGGYWLSFFSIFKLNFVLFAIGEEMENVSQDAEKMEGWLYLVRSNRFGLQYSRKRYFVLEDHVLKSFKSLPTVQNEVISSFSFSLCDAIVFTDPSILYLCACFRYVHSFVIVAVFWVLRLFLSFFLFPYFVW